MGDDQTLKVSFKLTMGLIKKKCPSKDELKKQNYFTKISQFQCTSVDIYEEIKHFSCIK